MLLAGKSFSQHTTLPAVVHIEKLTNELENIKPVFKVNISPWEGSAGGYNCSVFNIGLGGVLLYKNVILGTDYYYSIFDRVLPASYERQDIQAENISRPLMFSVNKSTPANNIEMYGVYFFKRKIKPASIRLRLDVRREGNDEYEKFTKINAHQLTRWGARLGFNKGITWYAFNSAEIYAMGDNGTITTFNHSYMSSMLSYSYLNMGFCFSVTRNLVALTKEYGLRSHTGMKLFYGDVMIAIKNELDNVFSAVYYNEADRLAYYNEFNINDVNPRSKLGFRLGFKRIPFRGNVASHFEVGMIPGLTAANNLFAKAGINVYFGTKP